MSSQVSKGSASDRHDPTPANAATRDTTFSRADGSVHTDAERPDLDRPDSEWADPEWPDPFWPGFTPWGRRPAYAFTLAASPWFKNHYPDKAANLWDALHAGRTVQPAHEQHMPADREAGE